MVCSIALCFQASIHKITLLVLQSCIWSPCVGVVAWGGGHSRKPEIIWAERQCATLKERGGSAIIPEPSHVTSAGIFISKNFSHTRKIVPNSILQLISLICTDQGFSSTICLLWFIWSWFTHSQKMRQEMCRYLGSFGGLYLRKLGFPP